MFDGRVERLGFFFHKYSMMIKVWSKDAVNKGALYNFEKHV